MLSIVIPTHDRTDLLRACLQSVTRYAPAGSEIVVVDDASPGARGSEAAAHFGVRVVRLDQQRGFAFAANAGIRASSGAVVEMLNDDTEVQPGWADAALPWFEDPMIGSVAPLVLIWPEGQAIDSAGDRYYVGGVAGKRGHGLRLSSEYLQTCRVFGVSAAAGFYRRSALERVGLFPEEFGSYFEDVDLAFRLQRAGFAAQFDPASRVLHHVSASYGRLGRQLVERQSCNEERVFWRNLPRPELELAMPTHLAVLVGKAWRRWNDGTLCPWLFGRLRACWDWRAIRQHRCQLAGWPQGRPLETWGLETAFWTASDLRKATRDRNATNGPRFG